MKKWLGVTLGMGLASVGAGVSAQAEEMNRLYNYNSGEHFYTNSAAEKKHLTDNGWQMEGVSWSAPTAGTPVYRLYNPNNGDHHYTLNQGERDQLIRVGWRDENIGWNSDDQKATPIYRAYNQNAKGAGSHHYTSNKAEIDQLVARGWKDEGIGWYGDSQAYYPHAMPQEFQGNWRSKSGDRLYFDGQYYWSDDLSYKYVWGSHDTNSRGVSLTANETLYNVTWLIEPAPAAGVGGMSHRLIYNHNNDTFRWGSTRYYRQ